MAKVNIILGPPGTGKTTTLLNLVDQNLAKGVAPNKIGFISFTKKATEEARDRAKARFNLTDDDLQHFRTIHSFAFKMMGMNTSSVMKFKDYQRFGEYIGIEIKGRFNVEDGTVQQLERGDKLIFIEQLSRVRCVSLERAWEDANESDVSLSELEQIGKGLERFKRVNGKVDYTDMLTRYHDEGFIPEFKVLFVDEAQDLSQLQWRIVQRMMDRAEVVYIAGDDDQAIFRWSGADVDHFINIAGEVTTLDHSYRLPSTIKGVADGLVNQIGHRREKRYNSNNTNGSVYYANCVDELNLSKDNWLVLVRNGYMIQKLANLCQNRGIFYSFREKGMDFFEPLLAARAWQLLAKGDKLNPEKLSVIQKYISFRLPRLNEDKVYGVMDLGVPAAVLGQPWFVALSRMRVEDSEIIKAMLRNGEKLQEPPRIRLSTIHGAKGGECDNVALLTDVSFKTFEAMQQSMDDEHRVFYVGATRAKQTLHIVSPETMRYYPI